MISFFTLLYISSTDIEDPKKNVVLKVVRTVCEEYTMKLLNFHVKKAGNDLVNRRAYLRLDLLFELLDLLLLFDHD